MISPFSRLIDYSVEYQFRRDASGRLIFLPFGLRKTAYFVDSKPDEEKIRSFLKMYRGASTLISWLGMLGIYAFGWTLPHYPGAGAIPIWTRLTPFIVSSLIYMLILLAWVWMLWDIYKKTVPTFTSSLIEVGPDIKGQLTMAPAQRRAQRVALAIALVCIGLMILIAFAVSARSHYRGTQGSPSAVCPQPK